MSERDLPLDAAPLEERPEWPIRLWFWVARTWRPVLGWSVLLLCMLLAALPAALLAENTWLRTPALLTRLYWLGPAAVVSGWLLAGWRAPWTGRLAWLRRGLQVGAFLLLGLLLVSQLLGEWMPGPAAWWQAARGGAWGQVSGEAMAALAQLGGRYGLWWQGVQENNAARDDLVLAGVAAVAVWLLSGLMVVLARRTRSGLVAALPILWPMGLIMLYSPADRLLFVVALAITLVLHLLLEQQALVRRWQAKRLDYNASLLVEKGLLASSALLLVLVMAALVPNLYIYEVTARYYEWLQPMNDQLEAASKRLFPGLTGAAAPWGVRGVAGGLPNAFLLGAGGDPGQREVMRVRTDEPISSYDQPPVGHPLRGATFADYDGRGWTNPDKLPSTQFEANQPWADLTQDRRPLLQSVNLTFASSVIYAAGEPEAPSIAYVAREHFPGDLALLAARTRSYTVVSQLPALDRAQLEALPAWGEANPLPDEYGIYLTLPVSVTQRTRDLAQQLTADAPSMYAKAAAIEAYLRTFPYDLDVTLPDAGVDDVADYFLFDLKRGYCDYYATAFVVLARAVGLPARFVTGFAPGSWSFNERQWIITEAEAHSWPEVYFPAVGWVRFEPTAYRPLPVRIGLPPVGSVSGAAEPFEPLPAPAAPNPWLLLWWGVLAAGPVALMAWGVTRWRRGREDPWLGLLRWGQRMGRPLEPGDTALEYGSALAARAVAEQARVGQAGAGRADEAQRTAAREVVALSEDVSVVQYGVPAVREAARVRVRERWERLRALLRRVRVE